MRLLLTALMFLACSPLLSGCITSAALIGRFICSEGEHAPKLSPDGEFAIIKTSASCGIASNQGLSRVWLKESDDRGKGREVFKADSVLDVRWIDARTVQITYSNWCRPVRKVDRSGPIRLLLKQSDSEYRMCTKEK